MSGGLIIRLKPHEKFLINGAVLENGDRGAKLHVRSPDVNILRLRDALHPSEATTPVKNLYYKAQLVVTGDLDPKEGEIQIVPGLRTLSNAFTDKESLELIDQAVAYACQNDFYRVMKKLKKIIPLEEKLLMIAQSRGLATVTQSAKPCSSSQLSG